MVEVELSVAEVQLLVVGVLKQETREDVCETLCPLHNACPYNVDVTHKMTSQKKEIV